MTIASTVASSFASVFIAKDTTISSSGRNTLLNKRNGQTISTSAAELHYDLFDTDEEEELDTNTSEKNKNTTTPYFKKLGCIGGHQIESLATGSLSQPVILTDPKGGVHKVDGHDVKFTDDGGVIIVESSGRIIQIKKDAACAASTEGRRLYGNTIEFVSYDVVITHCPVDFTVITSSMTDEIYGSSETVPDGKLQLVCHDYWGQWLDYP